MRNIYIHLFIGLAVLLPFWSVDAALNSYLKLDGASNGYSATNTTTSGASAGTINAEPAPPPEGSRDVYLDIEGIEGESAAGPAILEIDTVRGESPKSSTATVQNEQDLENLVNGILLKDENVKSVEVDQKKVKIAYKMPARFLGIFRSSIATRAEVTYSGEVKVSLPWYAFLFKKSVSTDDIESEARAILPEVGDEVLMSFESRARAVTTLSDIMKTKHDTVKNSINNIR